MKPLTIEEKLGVDKYFIYEDQAYILIRETPANEQDLERIIKACPAGLYHKNEDGTVRFDYAGCLECGTCRVLCLETVVKSWTYPPGSFGVEFRYG